jgi:hypothetical protein
MAKVNKSEQARNQRRDKLGRFRSASSTVGDGSCPESSRKPMKPSGGGRDAQRVRAKKMSRDRSPSSLRSSSDDIGHHFEIGQSSASSSSRDVGGVKKKMRCTPSSSAHSSSYEEYKRVVIPGSPSSSAHSSSYEEYKRVVIPGSPSSSRITSSGYEGTTIIQGIKITIDLVSSSSDEGLVSPQAQKRKEKFKAKEKVKKGKEKKKVNYSAMHSLYQIH